MNNPIRVFLVDDHKVVRKGLRTFLSIHDDIDVVGEAGNGHEALDLIERVDPDVVLMDLRMPELDGATVIARLSAERPEVRAIALTSFADDSLIRRAIEAGAAGYILKDADETEIVSTIRLVHQGQSVFASEVMEALLEQPAPPSVHLTDREQQVLALLARGLTNRQMADRLDVSLSTANFHVHNILDKLGAKTRTEAVTLARQEGLLGG